MACSPLLVDIADEGFKLTSPANGVLFDINADGQLDRVAWTKADSGNAWLALDRNGNGRIDDGSELFGNSTPIYSNATVLASNGFEALNFMQAPTYGPSRADAQIDGRDAIYSRLLLWTDRNHNGISEPDELQSAQAAGILAIGTEYEEKKRKDRFGNAFKLKGHYWSESGNGPQRKETIWDVWLQIAR